MICFMFWLVIIGEMWMIGLEILGKLIVEIMKLMVEIFIFLNLVIEVVLILLILGNIWWILVEINELVLILFG